jgi:serine-type D-Ala-D-Ala carboxypeptidase/endopeptidase
MDTMLELTLNTRADQFVRNGVGLAVGIINRGQETTYGFGGARNENSPRPDSRTLYEIGSITKVFTATLLAALVVEGTVHLQQPVRELIPEAPTLPPAITLLSLATHTSGLPRLPDNIWKSVRLNRRDPYANYRETDLLAYLRTVKPSDLTETAGLIAYSNLGMGLLGYALSRRLGMSYEEAIQERVCRRLRLADTHITLSSEEEHRLARPYDGAWKPASPWNSPSLMGSGSLRSCISDLLRFLGALLKPPHALYEELQLTLQLRQALFAPESGVLRLCARIKKLFPHRHAPGVRPIGIGLGWLRGRLPKSHSDVWFHNGSTGGYRSFAAFVPESQVAVAVLQNRGMSKSEIVVPQDTIDNLGTELLDALIV